MMEQENSFDLKIKSKCDLEAYINDQILKIKQLDDADKNDESEKLANNISYLSGKLNLGGMIIDPLTEKKYFVSLGQLRGGTKYASDCKDFEPSTLYGESDMRVKQALLYLVDQAVPLKFAKSEEASLFCEPEPSSSFIIVRIVIKNNNSKCTLQYCNSGSKHGYFFTGDGSAAPSFAGPSATITAGYSAGFVHTSRAVSPFGAAGYIVFRISSLHESYVIVFGWDVCSWQPNRVCVQIRAPKSTVEPSVHVDNLKDILHKKHHGGRGFDRFNQNINNICRFTCEFENDPQPLYELTIDDYLLQK